MTGLTIKEAAQLAGVSEATVKGWVRTGLLRQSLSGHRRRFTAEDLRNAQHLAHAGNVLPRWRGDPGYAGQRLRTAREQAGLTQLQLAVRIDLTNEEISRLEHGMLAPQILTLIKISQALEIDPERLVSVDALGLETLSSAEAATRLGVPPVRLERWMKHGVLPGTKLGGRWRIPAIAVRELAESGRLRGESRRLDG